jgi:hypothetical protein
LRDAGHPHHSLAGACNQARSRWVNTFAGQRQAFCWAAPTTPFSFTKYAHRYLAEAAWRFNHRFN